MSEREPQGHIGGCMCGICLIERNRRDARDLPAARWDRMRALVEAGHRRLFWVSLEPGIEGGKPIVRCDWSPDMYAALEAIEGDAEAGKYADQLIGIAEELLAAVPERNPPNDIDWADIKRAEADADRQIYGGMFTPQREEPA